MQAIADADAKHRLAAAAADAAAADVGELSLSQPCGSQQRRRAGGGTGAYLAARRAGLDGLVAALGLTPARARRPPGLIMFVAAACGRHETLML
jgi:hypothetical protein